MLKSLLADSPAVAAGIATAVAATLLIGVSAFSPVAAVALLVAVVSCVIAFRSPGFAIGGLAAAIMANVPGVAANAHGIPNLGTAMVAGAAAILVLHWLTKRVDLTLLWPLAVLAGAHIAAHSLSLLWVENPARTIDALIELAKNWLIALVVFGLVTSTDRLRTVIVWIVVVMGGVAALSVLQYLTGSFDQSFFGFANVRIQQIAGEVNSWRISGPLPDPNFYAQALVTCLPLAVGLAVASRAFWLRLIALGSAFAMLVALLFTFSRGGFVALAAVVVAAIVMTPARWKLLLLSLVLGFVAVFAAPQTLWDRLAPIGQAASVLIAGEQAIDDPAIAQRVAVLRAGLQMILDHPLLGIGFAQYEEAYPDYALANDLDIGAEPNAHNLLLETAAEGGLVGVAILFLVVGCSGWIAMRSAAQLAAEGDRAGAILTRALLLAFVGYLAAAFFLHDAFSRYFWLEIGLLLSTGRILLSPSPALLRRSERPAV